MGLNRAFFLLAFDELCTLRVSASRVSPPGENAPDLAGVFQSLALARLLPAARINSTYFFQHPVATIEFKWRICRVNEQPPEFPDAFANEKHARHPVFT